MRRKVYYSHAAYSAHIVQATRIFFVGRTIARNKNDRTINAEPIHCSNQRDRISDGENRSPRDNASTVVGDFGSPRRESAAWNLLRPRASVTRFRLIRDVVMRDDKTVFFFFFFPAIRISRPRSKKVTEVSRPSRVRIRCDWRQDESRWAAPLIIKTDMCDETEEWRWGKNPNYKLLSYGVWSADKCLRKPESIIIRRYDVLLRRVPRRRCVLETNI